MDRCGAGAPQSQGEPVRLGISTTVTRAADVPPPRIRYAFGDQRLIPEDLVLRRWRERSRNAWAQARGVKFDGCRLPPGTWRLLALWLREGLRSEDVSNPEVLQEFHDRSRTQRLTLRAPHASKFALLLGFLKRKGALDAILSRDRDPANPGIPDLFLYKVDRQGRVYDGGFVEVKRWNRQRRFRERVSPQQRAEIDFLNGIRLDARVVYLLERNGLPAD